MVTAALAGYAALVTLLAVLMVALWWTATGQLTAANRRERQAATLIQEQRQQLDAFRHFADAEARHLLDTGETP